MQKKTPKIVSSDEALKAVNSGDNVFIHSNCAYPEILVESMCSRADELENVTVSHLMTFKRAGYVDVGMEKCFTHNSLFTGSNVRTAINEGRADFTPVFLSEIPIMMEKGIIPVDVALLQLSPPDVHGFCSFGVSNECSKVAAECAKVVIAQINPNMPRVLGNNFINLNHIDYIVEADTPIAELPMVSKDLSDEEKSVYERIGANIASLIDDGSTLQMGIGVIPDAVLPYLIEKNDLGIHTEMFSDSLIDLIERGVVNGEKKTFLPGKVVSSFVLGSRVLFDYIDNNPLIEFRGSKEVNDPFNIARNDKMVSINSAIEIDLTGQVCADSIGSKIYSGFGGQVDFIRGASRSNGGKPIIAVPSTAKKGTISKIVPFLAPGAGVTTTKADVHYVITEHGIADLYGKTIRERVRALIAIAHPDFRDELERKAREIKYLW